jgi:hypothetical protein
MYVTEGYASRGRVSRSTFSPAAKSKNCCSKSHEVQLYLRVAVLVRPHVERGGGDLVHDGDGQAEPRARPTPPASARKVARAPSRRIACRKARATLRESFGRPLRRPRLRAHAPLRREPRGRSTRPCRATPAGPRGLRPSLPQARRKGAIPFGRARIRKYPSARATTQRRSSATPSSRPPSRRGAPLCGWPRPTNDCRPLKFPRSYGGYATPNLCLDAAAPA